MKKIAFVLLAFLLVPVFVSAQECRDGVCSIPTGSSGSGAGQSALFTPVPNTIKQAVFRGDNIDLPGIVVIEFSFAGCVPCRKLKRAILASNDLMDLWNKMTVFEWNATDEDDFNQASSKFRTNDDGTLEVPQVVFFKNGVPVKSIVGYKEGTTIQKLIACTKDPTRC